MRDVFKPGQKFGLWTVLEFDKSTKRDGQRSTRHFWLCRCECGTTKAVEEQNLKSGRSISCGCYQKKVASEKSFKDLTGQRFGRWLVLHRVEDRITKSGNRYVRFMCRCTCGKERIVSSRGLVNGTSQSCGCKNYEMLRNRVGPSNPSFKHGKSKTSEYRRRPHWWSKHIRNRDIVCIACQDIPENGHAHHLDAWQLAPDKREDPANGAWLCDSCHYEFHRLYGKEAIREQFYEWLRTYFLNSYLALNYGFGYEDETINVLGLEYVPG